MAPVTPSPTQFVLTSNDRRFLRSMRIAGEVRVESELVFFGIDPGKSGGVAGLSVEGKVVVLEKRPDDLAALCAIFRPWPTAFAMIEFVRSSPQMGVSSAFTFGRGLGQLEVAMVAAGLRYEEVLPRTWQKSLGIGYGGALTDVEKKNITKAQALALFPPDRYWIEARPITHATADALLIAEFCRLSHLERGTLHGQGPKEK